MKSRPCSFALFQPPISQSAIRNPSPSLVTETPSGRKLGPLKSVSCLTIFVGAPIAFHGETLERSLTPFAVKGIVLVLGGQCIFVVSDGAARRTAAVFVDAPERPGPERFGRIALLSIVAVCFRLGGNLVIEGVAVEPAVHHVRVACPPALAVVGVVVGEYFVFGVDPHVEMVAGSVGVDLQIAAIGAKAEDASAVIFRLAAVAVSLGVEDPFIADGHVEVIVHSQADVGRDVIVEVVTVGISIGRIDEIMRIFADSVVIRIHGQDRRLMHDQFSVNVSQREDRHEMVGENGDVTIGMNAEDPVDRLVGGPGHIHRVFANEDLAIGRRFDD